MPQGAARIVAATLALMLGYLGVLVVNGPRNATEVLPFFNWSLFSRVPAPDQVHYSVRLLEIDGAALDPPVFFDEASDLLPGAQAPEANELLQHLGRSLEAGDEAAVADARAALESRFLNGLDSAVYEVVRRRYDIVDRLECDCYLEETSLREFTLG
jgi:hypothetical protein